MTPRSLALVVVVILGGWGQAVQAQRNLFDERFRFASSVVAASGLVGFYNDPTAALGRPTRWVVDTQNGGPTSRVAASLTYGTWNVDPEGRKTVVTVPVGASLTLGFDRPIFDDPANPWGLDFIVFGNSFVAANATTTWATDFNTLRIAAAGDWLEPMAVSVSPDGLNWYRYAAQGARGADGLWPAQAFRWDRVRRTWGAESNWNWPVNPALRRSDLAGLTAADAIDRLGGSGGGTAYNLRESGFRWIRFVRIEGGGGEVDAVARVIAAPLHPIRSPQRP